MICVICRQAEIVHGRTSITLARGEFRLVVDNVPAYTCPSCSEAYIDEKTAEQLLLAVEEMYKVGTLEETVDGKRLHLK